MVKYGSPVVTAAIDIFNFSLSKLKRTLWKRNIPERPFCWHMTFATNCSVWSQKNAEKSKQTSLLERAYRLHLDSKRNGPFFCKICIYIYASWINEQRRLIQIEMPATSQFSLHLWCFPDSIRSSTHQFNSILDVSISDVKLNRLATQHNT